MVMSNAKTKTKTKTSSLEVSKKIIDKPILTRTKKMSPTTLHQWLEDNVDIVHSSSDSNLQPRSY